MPEGITKLFDKVKSFWTGLEKGQRTRIYIMAGVLVAAIVVTLMLTLKVTYVPLFDDQQDVNLQPVVNYLTQNNIKFQKGDNQIFVDSKRKKDIEFDLTTQGIVSPEVTFSDTWSKLSLTATESDKENLWKNYLTSDLVYKLKKFENVENATVQYSKPEKTYWVSDQQAEEDKGSAYVMLKTKKTLKPEQVEAAANVVAASLGIPADNITIVDQNLNPLSRNDAPDLARATSQDEMRRQRQLELEGKVYDIFKVGIAQNEFFDTMSVSANPVLDFDSLKSSSTQYTAPDADGQGFVKNEETETETLQNGDPGSVPGTDTNPTTTTPSYQTGSSGNSSYEKNHTVKDRIFNQTNSETEKALGKLINDQSTMSISLWYGNRIKNADGLSQAYLEQVRQTAASATGVPVQNITISVQKLAPEEQPKVTLVDTAGQLFDKFGFYVIMLILLLVMVITAMPKKKAVPQAVQTAALEAAAATTAGGKAQAALEAKEEIKDINIEEQSELKKQIEKFVQQNPDAVAQLLRNWIAEDWE
ncbi:MAG: flagellar M-ring protein FliF [Clostridia bacterium]|nr:flagellar M-ring protein FliF [Clostridia bacterium]